MMPNRLSVVVRLSVALGALLLAIPSHGDDEGVVLDMGTGNYTITYRSTVPPYAMQQVVFVPATKIEPRVTSRVEYDKQAGLFVYYYTLKNGPKSKQALVGTTFRASRAESNSLVVPPGWIGGITLDDQTGSSFRVGWNFRRSTDDAAGLKPGGEQSGFHFQSLHLPGVGVMHLWGASPSGQGFPDEGPSESSPVNAEVNQIMDNNFVSRYAAIPTVAASNPFDTGVVLSGIQKHIDTDLINMKLIDPTLASELDSDLQAAITAANGGNLPALRSDLDSAYALLEREHKGLDLGDAQGEDSTGADRGTSGLIDRLAAQVLAFDIRYVKRQLNPDQDKGSGQAGH